MTRASLRSSVVIEIAARARPAWPMGPIRSRSRTIRADLVMTENGWRKRDSTSITSRVTRRRPFLRLVGIGVAADVDGRGDGSSAWLSSRSSSLPALGLEEQLALEIEAGRQAHVGVGGPGVAVDAAVLAARDRD